LQSIGSVNAWNSRKHMIMLLTTGKQHMIMRFATICSSSSSMETISSSIVTI